MKSISGRVHAEQTGQYPPVRDGSGKYRPPRDGGVIRALGNTFAIVVVGAITACSAESVREYISLKSSKSAIKAKANAANRAAQTLENIVNDGCTVNGYSFGFAPNRQTLKTLRTLKPADMRQKATALVEPSSAFESDAGRLATVSAIVETVSDTSGYKDRQSVEAIYQRRLNDNFRLAALSQERVITQDLAEIQSVVRDRLNGDFPGYPLFEAGGELTTIAEATGLSQDLTRPQDYGADGGILPTTTQQALESFGPADFTCLPGLLKTD